jgi:hypothetical protein
MAAMSRRDLMRLGLIGGLAGIAASCSGNKPDLVVTPTPTTVPPHKPLQRASWPGHKPGQIYLGLAAGGDLKSTLEITGPVGVHRTFHRWFGLPEELAMIRRDQKQGRLPWVSFKPPSPPPEGWRTIASGAADKTLRRRARKYDQLSSPVVVTFHHEPQNEGAPPEDFAAAWIHAHDVMKDETGLRNVAFVPILGEWEFNERNKDGRPADFLPHELLERSAFLGIDVYQNRSGESYAERLGPVLAWLDSRGFSQLMIGVGETGSTDDFGRPSGAEWWSDSWAWAERNADRVGAISYFNSTRNNRAGADWLLTQSAEKLAAFRETLASPTACRLS